MTFSLGWLTCTEGAGGKYTNRQSGKCWAQSSPIIRGSHFCDLSTVTKKLREKFCNKKVMYRRHSTQKNLTYINWVMEELNKYNTLRSSNGLDKQLVFKTGIGSLLGREKLEDFRQISCYQENTKFNCGFWDHCAEQSGFKTSQNLWVLMFHSGVVEDTTLLEYNATSLCNRFPMLWINTMPSSSSVWKTGKTDILLGSLDHWRCRQ